MDIKFYITEIYSYDVIFMDTKERLLEEYEKSGARVLFGAEDFCWPNKELEVRIKIILLLKLLHRIQCF